MSHLANENEGKGDFKDKQFAQNEVADKVVEQCEFSFYFVTGVFWDRIGSMK